MRFQVHSEGGAQRTRSQAGYGPGTGSQGDAKLCGLNNQKNVAIGREEKSVEAELGGAGGSMVGAPSQTRCPVRGSESSSE